MEYQQIACGLPSVPRSTFPSMFQILSSPPEQSSLPNAQQRASSTLPLKIENIDKNDGLDTVENRLSKSNYAPQNRKISKSVNTKYQLYYYKQDQNKRSQSLVPSDSADKVPPQTKKVIHKKKLDPNNKEDLTQIQARKKRIKKFQYVTRDLPNSAFTTYFGKPTFEAYGRANSNPNLLTHNVMPHKGANNPKRIQSYYTALLKGKKHSNSTFIPRKPVEQTTEQYQQKQQIPIHLPLETPDLINNLRFTSQKIESNKNTSVPTHKISPMTQNISKKKTKPQKKKKYSPASKDTADLDDGLKYINTRANLLKIIENKKHNDSKLAYKVTQCYPFEWQNQQKTKQMTQSWLNVVVAGKPSTKGDSVSVLFHPDQKIK